MRPLKTESKSVARLIHLYVLSSLLGVLATGCQSSQQIASASHSAGSQGIVHGGQQPVAGASIQLYAVGTTGDGSPATPLLSPAATTNQNGEFAFGNYHCPSQSSLLYVVATGGNPGLGAGTVNNGLALMATLGTCASLNASTYLSINELTTVGAVYPLAPFMSSASAVGSSPADATLLANAFASSAGMVNTATGTVPGAAQTGISIPSDQIYTVADIIASCVNSAGGTAGDQSSCGNLYALTPNSLSIPPTDTITAVLNIANNPTQNTAALFNLVSPNSPFQPAAPILPPNLAVSPQFAAGLSATPGSLMFRTVTVGFAQAAQTVHIQNNHTTPISLTGWGFVGIGSADYLATDTNCGTVLAAASTCYYTVTFSPTKAGDRAAYLFVSNTSANSQLYVPLGGAGIAPSPVVLSTLSDGLVSFGGSNTAGAGYLPSFPTLLHGYFPAGSLLANDAVSGQLCWNMAQTMFADLKPQDTGNPAVTDMIGFNDANQTVSGLNTPGAIYYTECQMGANAYAALSSSNTIAAGTSQTARTGAWAQDNAYPNFPGLVSTTQNSCVSVTHNVPDGVFYLWYEKEYTSGGSLSLTSDGVQLTDTISGSSGLTSIIPVYINQTAASSPALARYVVSPGSHTIAACVTSPTGPVNDVHVYGFGFPPAVPNTAPTAPRIYLGGVLHAQDNPTDSGGVLPGLTVADTLNQQVAHALAADNLNVVFVNIRAFVDPHLGMLSVPDGSCNASANPGTHVNNCGTFSLEQAFWEAINGAFAPQ